MVQGQDNQPNKGFTLIELLVVIAIIAALAAMLYPIMVQAKDQARMKTCVSNLRQLGAAFRRYVDDYDGYALPLKPNTYTNLWVVHVDPLVAYIGQRQAAMPSAFSDADNQIQRAGHDTRRIWICPGDRKRSSTSQPMYVRAGASYMYPGPGGYVHVINPTHPWIGPVNALPIVKETRKVDQWARPERDMLFGDYWNFYHRGLASPDRSQSLERNDPTRGVPSVNLVMLDMHVTAVPGEDIIDIKGAYGKYLIYVLYTDNRSKQGVPKWISNEHWRMSPGNY